MSTDPKEIEVRQFVERYGDPFKRLNIQPENITNNEQNNERIVVDALKKAQQKEAQQKAQLMTIQYQHAEPVLNKCARYVLEPETRKILIHILKENAKKQQLQAVEQAKIEIEQLKKDIREIAKILAYVQYKKMANKTRQLSKEEIASLKNMQDQLNILENKIGQKREFFTQEELSTLEQAGGVMAREKIKEEESRKKEQVVRQEKLSAPLSPEDLQKWFDYWSKKGYGPADQRALSERIDISITDIQLRATTQGLHTSLFDATEKVLALNKLLQPKKGGWKPDYTNVIHYMLEHRKDDLFMNQVQKSLERHGLDLVSIALNSKPKEALDLVQSRFAHRLSNNDLVNIFEAHKANDNFRMSIVEHGFGNNKSLNDIQPLSERSSRRLK